MFYDTRSSSLVDSLPPSGYTSEGTLVQGLDLASATIRKSCGFLPVVSDTPQQPDGYVEDEGSRRITVGQDSVTVVRSWIPAPPATPPASISARQIRLWMVQNGISMQAISSLIAGIEDQAVREQTEVEWEFAPYVERSHPMIETLGQALGLTSEQIDSAFIQASGL